VRHDKNEIENRLEREMNRFLIVTVVSVLFCGCGIHSNESSLTSEISFTNGQVVSWTFPESNLPSLLNPNLSQTVDFFTDDRVACDTQYSSLENREQRIPGIIAHESYRCFEAWSPAPADDFRTDRSRRGLPAGPLWKGGRPYKQLIAPWIPVMPARDLGESPFRLNVTANFAAAHDGVRGGELLFACVERNRQDRYSIRSVLGSPTAFVMEASSWAGFSPSATLRPSELGNCRGEVFAILKIPHAEYFQFNSFEAWLDRIE
jgi:hypothetical protein